MSFIKLKPAFKDYIWGGEKLKKEYGKVSDLSPIAESWELSVHKDGSSIVDSGPYKGCSLSDYIDLKGIEMLGAKCKELGELPLLVKMIDAKRDLSIQVHPDDQYALKYESQFGKTEMWVVLEADSDSYVYNGFAEKISEEKFRQSINDGSILKYLNRQKVSVGDVIFIEANTIHGIGRGVMVLEVQQNSNVTYRVFDFNRLDSDGRPRELHVDKAAAIVNLGTSSHKYSVAKTLIVGSPQIEELVDCEYFRVYRIVMDGSINLEVDKSSFSSITVISGEVKIIDGESSEILSKGETALIDADTYSTVLEGKCEIIMARA